MRQIVQAQKIGDEIGFVLPPEVVERFGLEEGDELFVVPQDDGVRRRFRKYRNALRALADS